MGGTQIICKKGRARAQRFHEIQYADKVHPKAPGVCPHFMLVQSPVLALIVWKVIGDLEYAGFDIVPFL